MATCISHLVIDELELECHPEMGCFQYARVPALSNSPNYHTALTLRHGWPDLTGLSPRTLGLSDMPIADQAKELTMYMTTLSICCLCSTIGPELPAVNGYSPRHQSGFPAPPDKTSLLAGASQKLIVLHSDTASTTFSVFATLEPIETTCSSKDQALCAFPPRFRA